MNDYPEFESTEKVCVTCGMIVGDPIAPCLCPRPNLSNPLEEANAEDNAIGRAREEGMLPSEN